MKARQVAEWFLKNRPELRNAYNDGNMKLNKLMYFSSLLNYAVHHDILLDESFERWDRGPVLRSVYRDYRYNNLSEVHSEESPIVDEEILKVLNIVNLVFGDKSAIELSEKTHNYDMWKNKSRNEYVDFDDMSSEQLDYYKKLYSLYKHIDFENLGVEEVGGNKYYYFKDNLTVDDEIIDKLYKIEKSDSPMFIEEVNGTLVFS